MRRWTTTPSGAPTRARALALFTGALLAAVLAFGQGALAAPADPAAARVDTLHSALIEMMKSGGGVTERGRKITPAVEAAFDLPTMTRFAVGPKWPQLTPAQQSALTAAFTRLTVASYAHNFDRYGGERFEVDPNVQTRGADKIVQAKLIPPHDKPVNLIYRMRQASDGWKIIDVYYDGVSQLTTRRSDFAQPVASGGAEGLLAHLNTLTDKMLK
jgi:phospholipid transport system substrate-binding protein